jgi:phycocyanobilin:ferredoxin oxidoreductase
LFPPAAESLGQRSIPDWGKAIFSQLCVCIRPNTPEELAGFIKYAVALTRMHLQVTHPR